MRDAESQERLGRDDVVAPRRRMRTDRSQARPSMARGLKSAANPTYRLYHPRWHRERTPIFWWVRKPAFFRFIVRELTSVPVAYTALSFVFFARAVVSGPESYAAFVDWLRSPVAIGIHALVGFLLVFHSLTWLNLAPKALVLHAGGKRLPDRAVLFGHYAGWIGASAFVAAFLLWGTT